MSPLELFAVEDLARNVVCFLTLCLLRVRVTRIGDTADV